MIIFTEIMNKKSGFVTILGAPNAGKSTLINAFLNQHLSIVSPKPQTTRNRIYGIYTDENTQIIFTDTPGIISPKYKLQEMMKKEIDYSIDGADVILFLIDGSEPEYLLSDELMNRYFVTLSSGASKVPVIYVINKVDLITDEKLNHIKKYISEKYSSDEIIPVSALKNYNVNLLLGLIIKNLPESDFYFPEDIISPQSEKFFASEIIRGVIFKYLRDEIPFSVYVDIEEFKESPGRKDFIKANLYVEKESQKSIIIGKGGGMIKRIGENSRSEIEKFLGREVFLELDVKVSRNWRKNEEFLKSNFRKLSGLQAYD